MRTIIFLGLLGIAEAIRQDALKEEAMFCTVIFLIAAFMDVIEFILKINRHDKN